MEPQNIMAGAKSKIHELAIPYRQPLLFARVRWHH